MNLNHGLLVSGAFSELKISGIFKTVERKEVMYFLNSFRMYSSLPSKVIEPVSEIEKRY